MQRRCPGGAILAPLAWSLVLVFAAGLVFRVAQPYAFEGPGFFDVIDVNLDLPGDLLEQADRRPDAIT